MIVQLLGQGSPHGRLQRQLQPAANAVEIRNSVIFVISQSLVVIMRVMHSLNLRTLENVRTYVPQYVLATRVRTERSEHVRIRVLVHSFVHCQCIVAQMIEDTTK